MADTTPELQGKTILELDELMGSPDELWLEVAVRIGGSSFSYRAKPTALFEGTQGNDGKDGKSAYQTAVEAGYTGSEAEFAQHLIRKSTYEKSVLQGFTGSELSWIRSLTTVLSLDPTLERHFLMQHNGVFDWQTLTASDVGLDRVDNTADIDKPISTATQAALDQKVSTSNLGLVIDQYLSTEYAKHSDLTEFLTEPTAISLLEQQVPGLVESYIQGLDVIEYTHPTGFAQNGVEDLSGASEVMFETVEVVGSTITLTHVPKGGIDGILNFATVRYFVTNGDGTVAYDATLEATVNDAEFKVLTDEEDEWDGNSVQVQYLYTPPAA